MAIEVKLSSLIVDTASVHLNVHHMKVIKICKKTNARIYYKQNILIQIAQIISSNQQHINLNFSTALENKLIYIGA